MKKIVVILFLLYSFCSFAQIKLQGLVLNSTTKEPIPFCAIAFKGSSGGCISNEEGVFQFINSGNSDTLIFSCIGYQTKHLAFSSFLQNSKVELNISSFNLDEVVIYDKDDFLYEIFNQCKKNLIATKETISKTYFLLESSIAEQPVEFIECYYNGKFTHSTIRSLDFKNGRVGLAPYNDRFFVNSNISKVFTFIHLIGVNKDLPFNPFQLNSRNLKKLYRLKLESVSDAENKLWHIVFTPKDTSGAYFYGEVWIEKETANLKKISLNVEKTKHHPFLPLFEGSGKIKEVSMQINKSYSNLSGELVLDHIDFNYQLNYQHIHANFLNNNPDTSFILSAKGLMHFYDVHKPFILPYFEYDAELSDYQKITSLTYNQDFWTNNSGLQFSQKTKNGLKYFKEKGILLNFENGQNKGTSEFFKNGGKFFENNYYLWSAKSRISLKKNAIKNDTLSQQTFVGDLYNIKAQIFFDINPIADSIQHYSVAIFDVYQTFYNLPEEPFTNCFINIYFDLVEIERRKMETEIKSYHYSITELDALYKSHLIKLENQSLEYFKEVERGRNRKALEKWNAFVKQNLQIDNIEIFQLY